MALRRAVANGNWSNTATWDGGTLPTSADDVHSNNFTVTVDQDITVLSLSNRAASPAVAGGGFVVSAGGRTITAGNIYGNTSACVTVSATSGTVTINANVTAGQSNGYGILKSGNGSTLNINGNLFGAEQNSSNGDGVRITGVGTVNVVGDIRGGTFSNSVNRGLRSEVSTTINVTGNIFGSAILNQNEGIWLNAGGTLNVTGNLTANGANPAVGVNSLVAATVNVSGTVSASASASGLNNVNASSLNNVNGILFNNLSIMAVYAQRITLGGSATRWVFNTSGSTDKTLYSADTLPGVPSTANVRQGTVYGPSNDLTGTLVVPSPSDVRKGVPTDNTVGTAELTAEDLLEAIEISTNPIAERLRNVSTVQTTGGQITAFSS